MAVQQASKYQENLDRIIQATKGDSQVSNVVCVESDGSCPEICYKCSPIARNLELPFIKGPGQIITIKEGNKSEKYFLHHLCPDYQNTN